MSNPSDLLSAGSVEKPSKEALRRTALDRIAPDYAMLFFDHLYSEYLAFKSSITEPGAREMLEGLQAKRLKRELTWSDIYSFDLTLVHVRPLENLIRKAYDARTKYRSIAGQKEYDEYVASKPPNLPEIHIDPNANPPQPEVIIERALRADLEYLLSKVYLYYAILPVREGLRDWLTHRAVLIPLGAVVVIGILISINVLLNLIGSVDNPKADDLISNLKEVSVVFVTVLTVVLAGIVGGCVSMLQRIQSAPSEGDALFNLAALQSGWKGIFLSPLYGGIFAALLFVLFAAGLLEGSAFPRINTPRRQLNPVSAPSPTPSPTPSPSPSPNEPLRIASPTVSPTPVPSASPTPAKPAVPTPSNTSGTGGTSESQTSGESPRGAPTSTPAVLQRLPIIEVKDFLKHTGPADGTSYALLIVWSFIAGFAERLVPDTLNRLVTKNEAIQGT